MSSMEELLDYLDKQYEVKHIDLLAGERDRYISYGKIELLAEIRELLKKGVDDG